jgi:hypothetical protein
LDPFPTTEAKRIRRNTDVSQDIRYRPHGHTASDYDAEGISAPSRIPAWILLEEVIQALFEGGHGTAPDLIYARGIPDTPDPGRTNLDERTCTLIIIDVGFSRDLGCDKKHTEKTEKYSPLVAALKQYWGRVELVAIPIGHVGTTLKTTLDHLIAALSTVRPKTNRTNTSDGTSQPDTDSNARSHDYCLFKSTRNALTYITLSRLLGIISNMKRLVESLPGAIGRIRAHPIEPPQHTQAAAQHEAATNIHRTRTTRVPEDIAITGHGGSVE